MWLMFETLAGHSEVDDRQQHEDERLDEPDEDDIKRLPHNEQGCADDRPANRADGRQRQGTETGDETDHHAAGEDVAEKPERQRDWFDQLLENVERRENDPRRQRKLERLREAPQESLPAQDFDAVP